MTKDLADKAIQFKGKAYVQVKDRVNYFNEKYPQGCIETELVEIRDSMVIFKAVVIPDVAEPNRYFSGYSQASFNDQSSFVNKTSALENAETSAVGRALAFMGIGVIDSIASVDEINKTTYVKPAQEKDDLRAFCPLHKVDMVQKEGKNGLYWSHTVIENGISQICFGKGYK